MKPDRKAVSVNILGRDYQVICDPQNESQLGASARHLDRTMREIRASGKVVGSDRIAVMAALNVTNDMLHGPRNAGEVNAAVEERIRALTARVEAALQRVQ